MSWLHSGWGPLEALRPPYRCLACVRVTGLAYISCCSHRAAGHLVQTRADTNKRGESLGGEATLLLVGIRNQGRQARDNAKQV
jgi:hypothetical protein